MSTMAALSDYLKNKFRETYFKATTYTPPAVIAISLHTSDPTSAGTTSTEVANSGGYARQTINPSSSSNWTKDSGDVGKVSNSADTTFPAATAAWGTITHVAFWDNATYGTGNLLFFGPLSAAKTISSGDTFKFNAADLSVSFS